MWTSLTTASIRGTVCALRLKAPVSHESPSWGGGHFGHTGASVLHPNHLHNINRNSQDKGQNILFGLADISLA